MCIAHVPDVTLICQGFSAGMETIYKTTQEDVSVLCMTLLPPDGVLIGLSLLRPLLVGATGVGVSSSARVVVGELLLTSPRGQLVL